jgi:hypothetical protein
MDDPDFKLPDWRGRGGDIHAHYKYSFDHVTHAGRVYEVTASGQTNRLYYTHADGYEGFLTSVDASGNETITALRQDSNRHVVVYENGDINRRYTTSLVDGSVTGSTHWDDITEARATGNLFAVDTGGLVYARTDTGLDGWQARIPGQSDFRVIANSVGDVLVGLSQGSNGGAFVSIDFGQSWQRIASSTDINDADRSYRQGADWIGAVIEGRTVRLFATDRAVVEISIPEQLDRVAANFTDLSAVRLTTLGDWNDIVVTGLVADADGYSGSAPQIQSTQQTSRLIMLRLPPP